MRGRSVLGLAALLCGIALCGALWFFGRAFAEARLQTMLSAAMRQPVALTLQSVGLQQSQLTNIRIGTEPALVIPALTLAYDPSELRHGRLRQLALDNLSLTIRQTPQGWQLDGMPPPSASRPAAPLALPMESAAVQSLPIAAAAMTKSQLNMTASQWQLTLPFALQWQQAAPATLTLTSDAPLLEIKAGPVTSAAAQLRLKHHPAQSVWQGDWQLRDVTLPALPIAVPLLQASGTAVLNAKTLSVNGTVGNADQGWLGNFKLRLPLLGGAAQLQIDKASLPLLGGRVALDKTSLTLDGSQPLTVAPKLDKLPLADLIHTLTSLAAKGEGTISGTVPVSYLPNGTLRFGAGQLQADAPGVLQLPPEAIPGDNPQIALLRDLLQDLHYEKLVLGLTGLPDGKLEVQLLIEGRNPAVQQGKPVKFNIKLNGAVLDLLTQNLQLLLNPQQFLTKDKP